MYVIVVSVSASELCFCACIDVYDSAAIHSKKRKQLATDDDADEGSSDETE